MAPVTDQPREVLIRSRRHDANQVVLEVVDSGIGITPENADRLFSAFFTTKPDGMGDRTVDLPFDHRSARRTDMGVSQYRAWCDPSIHFASLRG
jgi:sensor histidine kinase regulating citrate/malate metabolism